MRTSLRLLALTTLLTSAACSTSTSSSPSSSQPGTDPSKPDMASSALTRNESPNVPAADTDALVAGNTQLAVDLYKTLGADSHFAGKNLFFSPHSISVALAMTYAGARGTTASEMAKTLHFTLPQDQLHNALNGLDLALSSRGTNAKASDGSPFKLRVTNSLWGLPKMPFEQPFLDTLATNYGAGIRLADFIGNPEGSRTEINGWVASETEDKIKDLLPQGSINTETRLVLVNAVYFNGAWAVPFEPAITKPAAFHSPTGDETADFMHDTRDFAHVKGDGFDAISLPYDGGELDMVAIVPSAGTIDAFEKSLDDAKLGSILSSLNSGLVQLTLPKFKVEGQTFSIASTLGTLGMKAAFDAEAADFSGMVASSVEKLHISDVVHQAFVSVDEKGTEAAAATAVVMAGNAAAPGNIDVISIDRPFIFAIRDHQTGAIVFLGRILHP